MRRRRDFTHAVQQASGGPLDFTRAFEEFLEKHPQSSRREQIVRALFRASKDRKDQLRVALYGEELLKKDPDDISLLEPVGEALNSMEDAKASTRALALGQRLERDLMQNFDTAAAPGETPHEKGKRLFEHARMLSAAYTIQADAQGMLGQLDQAVAMAGKAFEALPSADAARCLGRWNAKAGPLRLRGDGVCRSIRNLRYAREPSRRSEQDDGVLSQDTPQRERPGRYRSDSLRPHDRLERQAHGDLRQYA